VAQRNLSRSASVLRVLRRLRQAGPFALAAAPPLYLLIVVLTQTIDVPFADQWELVPLLARSYDGTLTLQALWGQHNEHRLLFPRLVMLILARLSGWNTHVEMLGSIALAAATLGVLLYQLRRTAQAVRMRWIWLAPVLSLAIFSLNQAESWWGGWNLQIFLCVLAICAGIVLLAWPTAGWAALPLAIFCGFIASYSYSPGLLIWPVGLMLLALRMCPWTINAGWRLALWSIAGVLVTASFFYRYTWSPESASMVVAVRAPRPYLLYAMTYLGAAPTRGAVEYLFGLLTGDARAICNLGDSDLCAYVNRAAIAAGVAGLLCFALLTWALVRAARLALILPYLGLGAYALGAGIMTSLGRASYGNYQALAQRYATTATLFWVALVSLGALCAHIYAPRAWIRALMTGFVLLFYILILLSSVQGLDHFRWQRDYLAPARSALYTLQDDALLRRLYSDVDVLRRSAKILRQHHLSVFRAGSPHY
jgi:hypothetical protein